MKAKSVRAMPKSGIAAQVAESTGLKKSEVTQVLSSLAVIGTVEVKKTGAWKSRRTSQARNRSQSRDLSGRRFVNF